MKTCSLSGGLARICGVVLVGLALAACSSASAPTTTTTTVPSLASSAAAIKKSFEVLFDLADPALAPKLAVVQDGSSLQSAMKKALQSSLAKKPPGRR